MNPPAEYKHDDTADRLIKITSQTRGLLYALASLAWRSEDDETKPYPSTEEAEGLQWLAKDLGDELNKVTNQVAANYLRQSTASPVLPCGEKEGGEA